MSTDGKGHALKWKGGRVEGSFSTIGSINTADHSLGAKYSQYEAIFCHRSSSCYFVIILFQVQADGPFVQVCWVKF